VTGKSHSFFALARMGESTVGMTAGERRFWADSGGDVLGNTRLPAALTIVAVTSVHAIPG
jgi:hypothetical protein